MHARSTTLTGKPEAIDAGIALVRDEIMPAIQDMPGCVGMSMLVDRSAGGCVVTSAWRSEDEMRATAQLVGPMRDRAQQLFGNRPEVREWEIAVLHRMGPTPRGAWARVTWTKVAPDLVADQLDIFRSSVLQRMEELPGFCSTSFLTNRRTGTGALATVYESSDALAQSRLAAADLRIDATRQMSTEVLDVSEFEVALAHLRVPETV